MPKDDLSHVEVRRELKALSRGGPDEAAARRGVARALAVVGQASAEEPELERGAGVSAGRLGLNPLFSRRQATRWFAGVAAVVAVGLVLWFGPLGRGQQTLYAQVARAMGGLGQVRMTHLDYRGGELYSRSDYLYQRGVGYAEHRTVGEEHSTTLDDGKFTWSYARGVDVVAKTPTFRDVDDPASFHFDKLSLARMLRFDPERDPSGDKVVEGEAWRLYTLDRDGVMARVWIDTRNRVRAFESRGERGAGSVLRGEVVYDEPIDPGSFTLKLPAEAQVVEPRAYLGALFDVEETVYRQELGGLDFAVHKLERLGEGLGYMVSSVRLTSANRRRLEIDHPWHYWGSAHLSTDWGLKHHERVLLMPVARVKIGDLIVQWHVLDREKDGQPLAKAIVKVSAAAANELEALLTQKGGAASGRVRLELALPAAEAQEDLGGWLAGVHALVQQVEPIAHGAAVYQAVPNPPKTNGVLQGRSPSVFSEAEFLANVRSRLEE